MENQYRRFKFTMRTLAPVHIGSGETYSSREFIYVPKEGKIPAKFYFPDMRQFYQEMCKYNLDKRFEQFLLEPRNHKNGNRLNEFLSDNNISIGDFGGYSISATGLEKSSTTPGKLNDISQMIRDGFGNPYVPGSSLKGAIRTILMNTHWKNKNFKGKGKRGPIENKRVIPWGSSRDKEQQVDDIFNEIRVSDSQPISNGDLIIVQKWDYSVDKNKVTALPLYRESIAPFKEVTFTITTSSQRAYQLIYQLGQLSQEHYKGYKKFFLEEIRDGKVLPKDYIQDNIQYPIYLGSGSGAWTKTVMRQADGPLQDQYARGRTKMVGKGAVKLTKAPTVRYKIKEEVRPLIKNSEHFYEMGKCCFVLKEIK